MFPFLLTGIITAPFDEDANEINKQFRESRSSFTSFMYQNFSPRNKIAYNTWHGLSGEVQDLLTSLGYRHEDIPLK